MSDNPLLSNSSLPPFSGIKPEHVSPAIKALIEASESSLESQLAKLEQPTWENLAAPIEERGDTLSKAWSPVSHLNSVSNNEELRKAYEESQQQLTVYYTKMGQNKALYDAYLKLKESEGFKELSQAQQKSIRNSLRDFELSGIALEGEEKTRYGEIQSKLSSLGTQFSNNVLDATKGWFKQLSSEDELAGLPEFIVAGAKKAAEEKDLEGYVLTLDMPVYFTVITQSDNAELRRDMYQAFFTRASDQGPNAGKWDNTAIIEETMALRQELAKLLGFNNYAELSIAPKMAESTQQVVDFLENLAEKSKPQAEQEFAELKAFAKEEYGIDNLDAWDVPYYSDKLKQARYSVSQETLRPYFPLPTVMDGLFRVTGGLFNIDIRESSADVDLYDPEVKFFNIYRNGKHIASFYFDLYARSTKRGGAWMDDCRVRRQTLNDGLQLPVAYMVCNFNQPLDNKPSLLTHNEVTTLFHEFGHGLHHMLTQIDVGAVSGINGVAWDAVELPSQFLENFCWEPEVLQFLSSHYESGESLPKELLDNMLAAKNFQSAMMMLRQIEFSLFDFTLHMEYGSEGFNNVQQHFEKLRDKVAVFTPPAFNRFQNGFSHIFAGGYSAGYYSYKWAEVLSSDAYSAFEEEGIFDTNVSQRYLEEIIERGGSDDAMALFKNFRGREPSIEPLLRHSGINTTN